jgi:hypothetical protein
MMQMQSVSGSRPRFDAGAGTSISIVIFGFSLSVFFAISYVICIVGYLVAPGFPVQHAAAFYLLTGVRAAHVAQFRPGTRRKLHLGLVHRARVRVASQFFQPAHGALSKGVADGQ